MKTKNRLMYLLAVTVFAIIAISFLASTSYAITITSPKSTDRLKSNAKIDVTFTKSGAITKAVTVHVKYAGPSNKNKFTDILTKDMPMADGNNTITNVPIPNISETGGQLRVYFYNDGDYTSTINELTIDNIAPTLPTSITSNPSSSSTVWRHTTSITINWNASSTTEDLKQYLIYRNSTNSRPANPIATKQSTDTRTYIDSPGDGKWYYWIGTEDTALSNDGIGNRTYSGAIIYWQDTQAPTVTVPSSRFLNTPSFTVPWSGSDAFSGISYYSYEVQISGGNWTACSNPFTGATDGTTYIFHAMATDYAGNSSSWSSSTSVTVDMTPPTSHVLAQPLTVEVINPTISWAGSDSSGIVSYHIQRKDMTATNGKWETVYDGAATSHTLFNADNTGANGHTFQIRSQATDRAGNVEATHATYDIQFLIEAGDVPRSLIMNPYTCLDTTPTFEWQAPLDNRSIGYSVSFESGYNETILVNPSETADTHYTYTTPAAHPLLDGQHILTVSSKNSENVWSPISLSFIIDTGSPTLSGITLTKNGKDVTVSGTANDAAQVQDIKYQLLRLNPDNTYTTVKSWASIPGDYEQPSVGFSKTETLSDGTYKFDVKAIDYGNHESTIFETGIVTVDANAPSIRLDIGTKSFTESSTGPVIVDADSPLKTKITDGNGIDSATLTITGIGNSYSKGITLTNNSLQTDSATTFNSTYDANLKEGQYNVTIVTESNGVTDNTFSVVIQVYAGGVRVLNKPFSYPNPFKPGISDVTIKYQLSRDSSAKLLIYNMNGKPVKTYSFSLGQTGGAAGDNPITWDGKDNFGKTVANGPYYYFLIVDGKVIGHGEMAAFQ